jgi:hypothetical protein
LPDALFVRRTDWEQERGLPLVGNLHVLTETSNESDLMRLVSKCADSLTHPECLPREGALPIWCDPRRAWDFGPSETTEIKAKLIGCSIVSVVMVSDSPDKCQFVYQPCNGPEAPELNATLAAGLLERRSSFHSITQRTWAKPVTG